MKTLRVPRPVKLTLEGALALAVGIAVALAITAYADAVRSRGQATDSLKAQTIQAVDERKALSRRIDMLSGQLMKLEDLVAGQQGTISGQQQVIADLSMQLRRAGLQPIASPPAAPAAPSSTSRAPASAPAPPQPSPKPATSPTPSTPAPQPFCLLGICIGG